MWCYAFQLGTALRAAILAGRFCIASDLFHRSIFSSTRLTPAAPIFSLSFTFLFLFSSNTRVEDFFQPHKNFTAPTLFRSMLDPQIAANLLLPFAVNSR